MKERQIPYLEIPNLSGGLTLFMMAQEANQEKNTEGEGENDYESQEKCIYNDMVTRVHIRYHCRVDKPSSFWEIEEVCLEEAGRKRYAVDGELK